MIDWEAHFPREAEDETWCPRIKVTEEDKEWARNNRKLRDELYGLDGCDYPDNDRWDGDLAEKMFRKYWDVTTLRPDLLVWNVRGRSVKTCADFEVLGYRIGAKGIQRKSAPKRSWEQGVSVEEVSRHKTDFFLFGSYDFQSDWVYFPGIVAAMALAPLGEGKIWRFVKAGEPVHPFGCVWRRDHLQVKYEGCVNVRQWIDDVLALGSVDEEDFEEYDEDEQEEYDDEDV